MWGLFRMPIPAQRTHGGLLTVALVAFGFSFPFISSGCEVFAPEHHPDATATAQGATEKSEVVARGAAPSPLPGKYASRHGYYVLYHDFELDPNDPIFADLDSLPDEVFGELKLPPGNAIVEVFLFDSQDRYERYMKLNYPNLALRPAYFLQIPRVGGKYDLKVYAVMKGEHLRTNLRHELTHGLLHMVLKDVPLWLDEGLAGYFELPPSNAGVNPQYLDFVRRGSFQPNLARLEKLGDGKQMEKPEYREAWAWVHFMLQSGPATKKVLQDYLQVLRTDSNAGLLLPQLREVVLDADRSLLDHLEAMEWPPVKGSGK